MSGYLLKNGTIWGSGAVADILVEGERIVRIAPCQTAENAETVDLTGKTVFPGFFNAHVHLYGVQGPLPDELIKKFVLGGCTTVRDMGVTSPVSYQTYLEWLAQRSGPEFPNVISAGKFICGANTYGAVHPSGVVIGEIFDGTVSGAEAVVDAMADAGAQLVKTGLDYGMDADDPLDYLSEETFRAICRRAKERGIPSSAHITKADNFVNAALWGLSESAHTPTDHLSEADIETVKASGMYFNTTASIFDQVSKMTGEEIMDDVISNIGRLYRAGVPMSVGTDYMHEAAPEETAGIPVHELTLLVKAGLTVDEVIRAATLDSAHICGVSEETGSIEEGKRADLFAIAAPVDDTFSAFEAIPFVMNRGTIIKNEFC